MTSMPPPLRPDCHALNNRGGGHGEGRGVRGLGERAASLEARLPRLEGGRGYMVRGVVYMMGEEMRIVRISCAGTGGQR